jgi:methylenetetrahydrofolate reductase (NADPH)
MPFAPRFSFEFFPPATDWAEQQLWQTLERLAPLGPDFVSVTYGAGGSTQDRSEQTLFDIQRRGGPAAAGHITCVGASRAETDTLAASWAAAGVTRLIALRGDMPELDAPYQPHPDGYENAAALVAGLRRIADFDISVAAYPESHPDSPSRAADLDNLKRKLDAGAERAITQFFFSAETFLRFRDEARRAGIDAPIVPGILPIFNFARVQGFSHRCGTTVPAWLAERFAGLDDDPQTRELVAATTTTELCQKLHAEGVDNFHFYTLNRHRLTYAVCRMLGIQPNLKEAA